MSRARARERQAAFDRPVRIRVTLSAGTLEQIDQIAAERGVSRSQALDEAAMWLIAREQRLLLRRARRRVREEHLAHLEQLKQQQTAIERALADGRTFQREWLPLPSSERHADGEGR